MDDRINWFQGWIIIAMIFAGISMLVHYENRSQEEEAAYYKRASYERQLILDNQGRMQQEATKRHVEILVELDRIRAMESTSQGLASPDWSATIVPASQPHAIKPPSAIDSWTKRRQ